MESLKQNKILVSAFVIVLLMFIYFFFLRGNGGMAPSASVATTTDNSLLNNVQQINSVRIDPTFFSQSSWTNLQDFSVPIPTLTPGKPNIFAPISGQVATTTK